ncbi:MAG TPA: hypothetical protein VGB18_07800 [Candidatus Thermoplasmatota archaeon]
MRLLPTVVFTLILSGCLGANPTEPTPSADPDDVPGQAVALPLFLKARYGMSTITPVKDTPDSITATQFQNAFVNEDLRSFSTNESHTHLNITSAKLVIYYNVDTPLFAPIVDQTDQQSNRIVFWLGSRSIYVTSANVIADPILLPGEIYQAEVEFDLPEPGWFVPKNEPIMLLFANLVPGANPPAPAAAASSNLHFLVDSNSTPSRVELAGTTVALDEQTDHREQAATYRIVGNTGFFTGATPGQVQSRIAIPVDVPPGFSYLEVRVVFKSTTGGKSDLDFSFIAPDGSVAAASTTPYQSETVRLFEPSLLHFGAGQYQAEVTAYSGADTSFELRVLTNEPR